MSAPGSGTLAGGAHQDSFEGLMAGTAASELVNLPIKRSTPASPQPGMPVMNRCQRPNHQNGCSCVEGDADPATAALPRPGDDPEPEGGWDDEDEQEDPCADKPEPRPAAPASIEPEAPAPAPKSRMRQAGEAALTWLSHFVLPAKYARKRYEAEHGPIGNRAPREGWQELTLEKTEEPLTEAEMAAFAALAHPNIDRMNQHRAEVEAALRAAADLDSEEEEAIANACNQYGHDSSCTGASIHKRKGARASRGNPAGKPTQSNTPLKAAEGASDREKVDATERALVQQSKPGASGLVQGVIERDGHEIDLSAGNPDTSGGQHIARHFGDKDFTPRKAARAIVLGEGEKDIVGSDTRVNRTHKGVSATIATSSQKLNRVERNRKKNKIRKAKIKEKQGKKPESPPPNEAGGDGRQKIITSHLRRKPKK